MKQRVINWLIFTKSGERAITLAVGSALFGAVCTFVLLVEALAK